MGPYKQKYDSLFGTKAAYFGPDVESKVIPPPIGGWDAISPISAMEPKYALTLDNWVPRVAYVELRGGYNTWCQNMSNGNPVESLMVYRPDVGGQVLFAALNNQIWNVSQNGLPSLSLSGRANNRWQYVNYTPGVGCTNYLIMCNGADPVYTWNGTAWSQPSITGVSSSTLVQVNAHKRRLWFVQANSTDVWYLGTDAISGAATGFALGSLLTKGGNIQAMATWTLDGGVGPDDYAVFVSSQGEYIVYKGTDPSNANAWSLVGVFNGAKPIGRRCFLKFNSDLLVITTQGLLPISQALPFDPAGVRSVALTNRIQNAMLQASQAGQNLFGWECIQFTNQAMLIMNVPVTENVNQIQYVMNTMTGAWCSFSGWNANCFALFNESLYFGDNSGNVNLAYTASLDLVSPIVATMKSAFNYFDDPGRSKQMSMIRPLLVADGTIIPTIGINVDFADNTPTAPVTILTPAGAVWDASTTTWDSAVWSTGAITVNNWLSVSGLGTALSIVMQVNVAGSTATTAQNSVFDTGVFDSAVFDGNGAVTSSGQNLLTLRINSFEALMEFSGPI